MKTYHLTTEGYLPADEAEALWERKRKEREVEALLERWRQLAQERESILDEMVEVTRQITALRTT
jgi:phage-related minor tail protein